MPPEKAGLDLAQKTGTRVELRADRAIDAAQAAPAQVAVLAEEAAADRERVAGDVQVARGVCVIRVQRQPLLFRQRRIGGEGGEAVEAEHFRAREAQLTVEPDQAVEISALLAAGVERSQEAVGAQGALVAKQGECRPLRTGTAVQGAVRGLIEGEYGRQGVLVAQLARQLEAQERVDDLPGVHGGQKRAGTGQLEDIAALHEERPLFGIIERVAQVRVDLAGVRLHLAEVGVPGQVEDQLGGQSKFAGDAKLAPGFALPQLAPALLVPEVVHDGRQHLQQGVAADVAELERLHLREEGVALGRVHLRHGAVLGGAADVALEEDRHLHPLPARVADGLEGDAHLHRIAVGVEPAGARPDEIGAEILGVAGEAAVALDAQRVDVEGVERLLVVEAVEVDADEVVGHDRVAAGHAGLDPVRRPVVTAEGEVQVFSVVGHVDRGLLGEVLVEIGDEGPEAADRLRLPPGGVVEHAVDQRRGRHALGLEACRGPAARRERANTSRAV